MFPCLSLYIYVCSTYDDNGGDDGIYNTDGRLNIDNADDDDDDDDDDDYFDDDDPESIDLSAAGPDLLRHCSWC